MMALPSFIAPSFPSPSSSPSPIRRRHTAPTWPLASPSRRALPCAPTASASSTGPSRGFRGLFSRLKRLARQTRPGAPFSAERYDALPAAARNPAQMLGRLSPGCEGTHGVFPKCNFACTPCYHSADANRVRVDGMHTVVNVAAQMEMLQEMRGPVGHCQLIGGEVSLLPPEDHQKAREIMEFYGRIPMSFTHGDFDYDYLRRLALGQDGKKKFARLDFAAHFDMYMVGRKDIGGSGRPMLAENEMDLAPYRRKFVDMFQRLKREHGVNHYLAHNMTIQEGNLNQIAGVVRDVRGLGFRMLSFQPAAFQGDERRWSSDYASVAGNDGEDVWREIERGAGTRLPYKLFQMGDLRCNRTCLCGIVGDRTVPFFDDECEADVRFRDVVIMKHFGNLVLRPIELRLKVLRFAVTRFWLLPLILLWAMRFVARAGGFLAVVRHGVRPITFVMHRFMDAENVSKAWSAMEAGMTADDPRVESLEPRVRETVERLSACSYGMAQVSQGRIVPACVQHSVYDPVENAALKDELKLSETPQAATKI